MRNDDVTELKPIREPRKAIEKIEDVIRDTLKRELYVPILKLIQVPQTKLQNSPAGSGFNALWKALSAGSVTYYDGEFSGAFNAEITRTLKKAGATWNSRRSTFTLAMDKMPQDLAAAVRSTSGRFPERIAEIDAHLRNLVPEELAKSMNLSKSLDEALFQVHKQFIDNVGGLGFKPELTDDEAAKITAEWEENLSIFIKDFAEDEIKSLRAKVKETAFEGNRYGALVKTVQDSYGVTAAKAKFLARQETRLLTTKYQESRYTEAGVTEYRWRDSGGTALHPVRPRHHALSGTIQKWDEPPVTTEPGEPERRNNPGQDFNCRCQAIPVVRFKK